MVFSDLDGTLIDHETYEWTAAKPALDALRDRSAAIILASSKTAVEMDVIRSELGLGDWPAIVENGAGILPPGKDQSSGPSEYNRLRRALDRLPLELRHSFQGFGDLNVFQVAEITGLPEASAALAKQRCFSEPGLWSGSPDAKDAFLEALKPQGIIAQQGGRFLTLSFGGNKVDQMRSLIAAYQPDVTIALGDAPNDIAMLEAADFGVVVANPHRSALPRLTGEFGGYILRTTAAGPSGWNAAVLDLIKRIEME